MQNTKTQHCFFVLLKGFIALQEIQSSTLEFGKRNWRTSLKINFKKSNAKHSTNLIWTEILSWLTFLVLSSVRRGMKTHKWCEKHWRTNPLSGNDVSVCPLIPEKLFICWRTSHSSTEHPPRIDDCMRPLFQFTACPNCLVLVWILNPPENCEEILPSVSLHFLSFLCTGPQTIYDDITDLSK